MVDIATLLAIMGTFLTAGMVKGVISLGLPTVNLAFLTVAIDLPRAMALPARPHSSPPCGKPSSAVTAKRF